MQRLLRAESLTNNSKHYVIFHLSSKIFLVTNLAVSMGTIRRCDLTRNSDSTKYGSDRGFAEDEAENGSRVTEELGPKSISRRINRKMDIALLPFLSLLYLFNGLDRSNVGNAETQGALCAMPMEGVR